MAEPSRAPETHESVQGAHFLIVEARFYDAIGALQLEGATQALEAAQARWTLVRAPGALEIPAAEIYAGVEFPPVEPELP